MHSAPSQIIEIASGASVAVVEDSEERIAWFRKRIPDARFFSAPEDAIQFLASTEALPDVCFLDCDLDWKETLPGRTAGGIRIAAALSRMDVSGCRIVIHSVNETGAREMKRLLPSATVKSFGTFDIFMA